MENKIVVDRTILENCYKLVTSEIKSCVDNPMYRGTAPKYLYELQKNLEEALHL